MKKRTIFQGFLASLISLATIYFLTPRGTSLFTVFSHVRLPKFLILAGIFFLFFLLMEALTYRYIFKLQGLEIPLTRTYGYSLVDYFFSSISPGGSAGQPGQLYYMNRDQIPLASSMMGLVVFNTSYHLAMVVMGLFAHLSHRDLFSNLPSKVTALMVYGILIQVFLALFQGSVMVSQKKVPHFVLAFLQKMKAWKVPFLKRVNLDAAQRSMEGYARYGAYFKKNPQKLLPILLMNILLLVFSYAISYFVYRSLGYKTLTFLKSIALQSQLVVATEGLPLPGGVGAAEGVFYRVYQGYVPEDIAFFWMILTRLLTYYLGLGLGMISLVFLSAKPYRAQRRKK